MTTDLGNLVREWKASVTCEAPQLPRRSGNLADDCRCEDDDDDGYHCVGSCIVLCGIEKDLDEGVAGVGGQNGVNIAESEAQGDDHDEA